MAIKTNTWSTPDDFPGDDTQMVQACVDAAQPGTEMRFPRQYVVSSEIDFVGKLNLVVAGPGGINFIGTNTQRSALSLVGADALTFRDFKVHSSGQAFPPRAIIAIGRKEGSYQGSRCQFHGSVIDGYATDAGVYSIASEVCTWKENYISLHGGGGKKTVYISQQDDLGLGGIKAETYLTGWWANNTIANASEDEDAAALFIYGRGETGNLSFRDNYLTGKNGSAIEVFGGKPSQAYGPFVFDHCYMESNSNLTQFVKFNAEGDIVTWMSGLKFRDCYGLGPAEWFFYSADNVILSRSTFDSNLANEDSSFYGLEYTTLNEHYGNIEARYVANYCYGFVNRAAGGSVFNPGSGYANILADKGRLILSGTNNVRYRIEIVDGIVTAVPH